MKKKLVTIVSALLMLIVFLSACGQKEVNGPTPDTSKHEATTEENTTENKTEKETTTESDATVYRPTVPTQPVSDPTRASTTCVPDVSINFLYKPEKIIFYHNGKPQTLTEEMCEDVIDEINKATRKEKWGMLKLAVFNEDIDKIKEENYCIEIHYDINSDGTQLLNGLKGESINNMTFRFEKVFIPLSGNYEGVMFFEKDGIYRSGPIKAYNYNLSEEILKDILDEWVTPPLTLN